MKKCGNRLICVYVCSKKYLKKWQIHLVIIILIMMKTLQNIWKHKREFQINIFMVIGIDKLQFVGTKKKVQKCIDKISGQGERE